MGGLTPEDSMELKMPLICLNNIIVSQPTLDKELDIFLGWVETAKPPAVQFS